MRKSPFSAMVFTKNRERLLRGGVTDKTNKAPLAASDKLRSDKSPGSFPPARP